MNRDELNQLFDLVGKTIVITGGSGILGSEIACALVQRGASVINLDLNLASVDAIKQRMGKDADRFDAVVTNILEVESLSRTADVILAKYGKVDILINAAGGNRPQATTSPENAFFDLPADMLRWVVDLNLLGTILPCQIFGRAMARQEEGVILNIASMNAIRPLTRIPAYSAAKAAVANFTQWLAVHMAQEYSPRIRVNAIAPGFFLTQQNKYLLVDEKTGEWTPRAKTIIAHTPMNRFGQPEDLIGSVLWLLSPASNFVSGIIVPIDGGFSAFGGV